MILQSRKLSITQKDDADNSGNDTTVELSTIQEGVDGAAIFGITNEHSDLVIENNQSYVNSANPSLDVRVLKPTGDAYAGKTNLAQIKEWADEQQDVYVSMLNLDGVSLFGDYGNSVAPFKISINEQLSDADIFAFRITKQTVPSFDPVSGLHQSGFWSGVNILGGYNFQEGETTNFAAGWTNSGGGTATFSAGAQTFSTAAASNSFFQRDVFLPYNGEQVTASINVTSATVTGSASLDIVAYDVSDSPTGTTFSSPIADAATGLISRTATLPSGTQYVRVRIKVNDASVTFNQPMLALGTNTTYTKL